MKTTELRIGNLVNVPGIFKEYSEILEINKDRVNVSGLQLKYHAFNPVPLTKEWLLKFGFENQQIELDYPDKLLIISATVGGKYYFYLDDADGSTFDLNYIQYVHQLQNLYFILTGTELEIR